MWSGKLGKFILLEAQLQIREKLSQAKRQRLKRSLVLLIQNGMSERSVEGVAFLLSWEHIMALFREFSPGRTQTLSFK